VLYADYVTESMTKALWETYRRRNIQIAHNQLHSIIPSKAQSNVKNLEVVKTDGDLDVQDF
jgi:excinuclease ABC subunit B